MTPLLSGGVGNEARGHYTVTGGGGKMPGSVVVGNPQSMADGRWRLQEYQIMQPLTEEAK